MKNHCLFFILHFSFFIFYAPLHAEVVTDGTLGQATTLPGPNYLVSDTLGQQVGGNLFHSFQSFNINTGEAATFTGSLSVENILARVTGGNHSLIDGTLRSNIPNANLYLLNPNGILFGENARLDITGSFHASTADYLRLGENGRFSARYPNQSLLTVAPPEAFGFLQSPTPITIQGSRLRVPSEKTISMIGGDLQIEESILLAPSGRINLASIATAGEVIPSLSDLATRQVEKKGTITISQSSTQMLGGFANLDVSGLVMNPDGQIITGHGGQVFIRAGQLFLNKGSIFADTYKGEGLGIDIVVDGDMHLRDGARITADNCPPPGMNCGKSQVGAISVTAQTLRLSGYNDEIKHYLTSLSKIAINNFSTGDGKEISIHTSRLEINQGVILSATNGTGKASNIKIETQQVNLHGGFINAATGGMGQAGDITINARDSIFLRNHSSISASTTPISSGNGGNIDLTTHDLRLTNVGEISSYSYGIGKPGSIKLTVDNARLTEHSHIVTEAIQIGGGEIDFQVRDNLFMTNSLITAQAEGNHPIDSGGNISIHSPFFAILNDRSKISTSGYAGNGGNITINPHYFISSADSVLDASSELGVDGTIQISAPDTDLIGSFVTPYQFFDLEKFKSRCEATVRKDLSNFYIKGRDIRPTAPDDFQSHNNQLDNVTLK
jgi:filamentous hemagglutinin family protein